MLPTNSSEKYISICTCTEIIVYLHIKIHREKHKFSVSTNKGYIGGIELKA
jgi:hypothetical protein